MTEPFSNPIEDELNGLRLTVEEGTEIHDELVCAIAGLAGEGLEPCGDSTGRCIGHFGPRARALMDYGLALYRGQPSRKASPF